MTGYLRHRLKLGDKLFDDCDNEHTVRGMYKQSIIITQFNNDIYAWDCFGVSLEENSNRRLLPPKDSVKEFLNLPVDTPIWVRDYEGNWIPRHFCKVEHHRVYTWAGCGTSHTTREAVEWDEATTSKPL